MGIAKGMKLEARF